MVPSADAVVDPGTVMVHVENAPVASRAMVASLRLEDVAHQAIATTLVLRIA